MKINILVPIFICLLSVVKAQIPTYEWTKLQTGTMETYGLYVAIDNSGNVYTSGGFSGTTDFDPGSDSFFLTAEGMYDIFISKINAQGIFQWARKIGGKSSDIPSAIAVDSKGNVVVTGCIIDTTYYNDGLDTSISYPIGGDDIMVLKLSTDGEKMWLRRMGGVYSDVGYGIAVDLYDNVVVAGCFEDTMPLDKNYFIVSKGDKDAALLKFDASGNLIWGKGIGSVGDERALTVSVDVSGNIIAAGMFSKTVDFDPGLGTDYMGTAYAGSTFIVKLGANGTYAWGTMAESFDPYTGFSCAVDAEGNIYMAGSFTGSVYWGRNAKNINMNSKGASDIILVKLNKDGKFIWARSMGGSYYDNAFSIALDLKGQVYLCGRFSQTVDFDPGVGVYNLKSEAVLSAFTAKLDTAGKFLWAEKCTGTGQSKAYGIAVDRFNDIYTVGEFEGAVDFNPDTATNYTYTKAIATAYAQKFSQCNGFDIPVVSSGKLLLCKVQNATYQWIDCDSSNHAIAGATQTRFTANKNGHYAVVVTLGQCADTSACYTVTALKNQSVLTHQNWRIFPNPSRGWLNIETFNEVNYTSVEVFNALGISMGVYCFNSKSMALDLQQLATGCYVIKFIQANGVLTYANWIKIN